MVLARPFARRQAGLTLLELMIGMTIGLVGSLAIVQVFSQSEVHRRTTAGAADAQQAGTIASWRLMRDLRLAGSGLQHGQTLWGCPLQAWRGGATLLPRGGGWPAPFAAMPAALSLAPIAVLDGGGNAPDSIVVMSARTGAGPAPLPASVVSATELDATTSVGFAANDLLLLADMGAVMPCQIGQVAPGYAALPGVPAPRTIPLGAVGSGYNGPAGFTNLPADRDYAVFNLGRTPSIAMYGIEGRALVQLDALQTDGLAVPTVQAENVENLQVLYGVDDGGGGGVANDNVIDRWVTPGTPGFTVAEMLGGGMGALQVKAIRVALVMRSAEPAQRAGPAEVVVFPDQPAALRVVIPIPAAERAYARQVYDFVVPLRNQWIALCSEGRRAGAIPAPGTCG